MKVFLATRNPRPPCIPKEIGFSGLAKSSQKTLPSWLTEEDVNYYATKFGSKGFTGGLNYYRAMNLYDISTFHFVLKDFNYHIAY